AREGGREDRGARAPQTRAPERSRLPRGEPERGRALLRPDEARQPRGVPVPGDLRLPAEDDVEAARGGAAGGVLPQLEQGRPSVRTVEEPDAVRRAHDRLDDRT